MTERVKLLEAVAEAVTAMQFDGHYITPEVCDALAALDALPADPAPAEVVEVAVWENLNGDYFFIKPGRDNMGFGWTRLGTTRLPLTVEAPR